MLLCEFSFLGLNWTTILVHLAVFVVLVVGLTFLVYKPVLKFVRKRQEDIQNGIDEAKATKEEGESLKEEYQAKMQSAKEEADAIIRDAQNRSKEILLQAEKEVQTERLRVLEATRQEAEEEKQATIQQAQQELGGVAVSLASEVLRREVSFEDNERLIAESLSAWSDNE